MRPPLAGFALAAAVLLISIAPACAQHAGRGAGHAGGGFGAGHHGAGGAAGANHHSGAVGYGYGGVYAPGFGAAYGFPYAPLYAGGGGGIPYGNGGAAVFSTATYPGGGGVYAAPRSIGYYTPLVFLPFAPPDEEPPPSNIRRPPDDAGHFELIVPYEAAVFVNGARTQQTGFIRHFNTPKLTPGYSYNYQVRVRYVNLHGEIVEDARTIEFKANDWFRIDFTRLPPPKTITSK